MSNSQRSRHLTLLIIGVLVWPSATIAQPAYRLSLGSYLDTPVKTEGFNLVSVFQIDYPLVDVPVGRSTMGIKVTVANNVPMGLGSARNTPYRLRTSLVSGGSNLQLNAPPEWGSLSRLGVDVSISAGVMTPTASPDDNPLSVSTDSTVLGAWAASLSPTLTLFDAGSYRFSTYLGVLIAGGFGQIEMDHPGRRVSGTPWTIGLSAGFSVSPKPKLNTEPGVRLPRATTLDGYANRTPSDYYDRPPKGGLPPSGCPSPLACPFTHATPKTRKLAAIAKGSDVERFHALNDLYVGQLHDRTPDRVKDGRRRLAERSADEIFKSGWRDGCIDAATAYTGLLRAAGIPAVFIHGIDDGWVRDSLQLGRAVKHYRGHTFVEVWLDGRWHLVDPSRMVLYKGYSPRNENLPDNYRVQFKAGDLAAVGVTDRDSLYRAMRLFLRTGPRARKRYQDPAYDEVRLNVPLNILKGALSGSSQQAVPQVPLSGAAPVTTSNGAVLTVSGLPRQPNGHYELWQQTDIGVRHVWSFNVRNGHPYDLVTLRGASRITSEIPMANVKWWGIGFRPQGTDGAAPPRFVLTGHVNPGQPDVHLTMYHEGSWELEMPRYPIALTLRKAARGLLEARLCAPTEGGWYPRAWRMAPGMELQHRLSFREGTQPKVIDLRPATGSGSGEPLCAAPGTIIERGRHSGPFQLDIFLRPMQSSMRPVPVFSLPVSGQGTWTKRVSLDDLPRAKLTME